MTENYHTHTARCRHATGTEEEYVLAAIDRGLKILGFSDHTPLFSRVIITPLCVCIPTNWKTMWQRFWR